MFTGLPQGIEDEDGDNLAILRFSGESPELIQDVARLFIDLDYAYASISYFFRISNGRVLVNLNSRAFPYRLILPPRELFFRTERLRFYSTAFSSPGFWEVIGKLNPLEVIRNAINDHREWKYRNDLQPYERRKRELENLRLENEVISGRIEVLKELGLDDEQTNVLIIESIIQPSEELLRYKENGLIKEAQIRKQNSEA